MSKWIGWSSKSDLPIAGSIPLDKSGFGPIGGAEAARSDLEPGRSAEAGSRADPMDYDALCELETHLGGVLVARAREAATAEEREMWRRRHDDQVLELQAVDPYDAAAVASLREDLAGRLRALT